MTININELREKITIKGLDVVADTDILAALDRLEAAEKERDFAKTEIARLHDDIRELTDVRVLDEEDRDRVVAWLQGTSTKPEPSVPDGWMQHAARMAALARKLREPDWHFESIREMQRELCALEEAALAAAPEAKT